MFRPALILHPFFAAIVSPHAQLLSRICHHVMSELFFRAMDEVFVEDAFAEGMYILTHGHLQYNTVLYPEPYRIHRSDPFPCLSEAVLWGFWRHCGSLEARQASVTVLLRADSFIHVVTEAHFDSSAYTHLKRYAQLYSELIAGEDSHVVVTDVLPDRSLINARLSAAFPFMKTQKLNSTALARSVSRLRA